MSKFRMKIKLDDETIVRANADTIEGFDPVIKDLKKKFVRTK